MTPSARLGSAQLAKAFLPPLPIVIVLSRAFIDSP